ncbi:hypothetical protein LMG7141_00761 [Ralstonia condita]|uniref:Uncharacterized protein n=1 Tax=Ralstonia condita TaxID=3058600 RepID=A0ABM9J0K6_9RALS|nr:hypothetical protein [Ralstonia sp. LMG 7141]CAJ0778483.1 hypothetical protein LMG7141_00761 [Ralstonia sp. LMG 7141]
MQVTTQRSAIRALAVTAGGLALALGATVAHAGSIEPDQPIHKVSRADLYTDGAKIGRADPYTDGARTAPPGPYTEGAGVGRRDPYTDGA